VANIGYPLKSADGVQLKPRGNAPPTETGRTVVYAHTDGTLHYKNVAAADVSLAPPDLTAYETTVHAAATYETQVHAAATYATIANAETQTHAAATYETQVHAAATYETASHAAATYATIANAETQSHAAATYLTIATAASTYETQAHAAATYALPSQTGNSGKFLTTNGTTPSWATVSAGASTLAATYTAATATTDNVITLSAAKGPVVLKDAATSIGTLFALQSNAGVTGLALAYDGKRFNGARADGDDGLGIRGR
jgi:hypothetical protein